jgi:hypothetical protein
MSDLVPKIFAASDQTPQVIAARPARNVRSLRIEVSMTSGPERPDAEKGDQRSPDAMD